MATSEKGDSKEEPRVVYLVGRIDRGLRRELGRSLREFELSVPEYTAMSVLARRPGLSNAQLARRSLIAPQSMIDVVARLEDRGLVARGIDPGHARILPAHLTPAGESLLERAQEVVTGVEAQVLSDLTAAERDLLRRAMTTVMQRLRDDNEYQAT